MFFSSFMWELTPFFIVLYLLCYNKISANWCWSLLNFILEVCFELHCTNCKGKYKLKHHLKYFNKRLTQISIRLPKKETIWQWWSNKLGPKLARIFFFGLLNNTYIILVGNGGSSFNVRKNTCWLVIERKQCVQN